MARIPERKFDPACLVYARKYFIAAGRKYVPGDVFDWKAAMVTPRRALQMFDAGKLTHEGFTVEAKPEPVAPAIEPEVIVEDKDDLDEIEDMKELRRIADEIGAPYKVSKVDQREAIRAHRKEIGE
jgi:hypothetical protein